MAIFVITAPSGAGKTTIMKEVAENRLLRLGECISTTSRLMRENEVDGVTYYYVTRDKFLQMKSENAFAESVEYAGNLYGIEKREIESVLERYQHVYIIAEYNGYKQIKEQYPEAVGIFLHMEKGQCFANMINRGDDMEAANKRLSTYEEEMANRGAFDYVVKNVKDEQVLTVQIIKTIILRNS